MRRSRKIVILLAFVAACCLRVQAQPAVVHDYAFTTGVDTSLWIDMTASTSWLINEPGFTSLPFTFSIWNRDFDGVVFYPDGSLLFTCVTKSAPTQFFPDRVNSLEPVTSGVFGYKKPGNQYFYTGSRSFAYSKCLNPDSAGHRIMVFQLVADSMFGSLLGWQVHLHEEDNSFTIVYGLDGGLDSVAASVGVMLDSGHVVVVDQHSHTASSQPSAIGGIAAWPGQYRYYHFVPTEALCPTPAGLYIGSIRFDGSAVSMLWHPCTFYTSFKVEHGTPGFEEGTGTQVEVYDTTVMIDNLIPEEDVEVRVYGNRNDSCSGYIAMVVHLDTVVPTEVHGYVFTSGMSSDMWYDMTGATDLDNSAYYDLPFPVFVYDRVAYRVFVSDAGSLLFNSINPYHHYSRFPSESTLWVDSSDARGTYAFYTRRANNRMKCFYPDSIGHRVLVIQQRNDIFCFSNTWQVQMREEDHSITYIYGRQYFGYDGPAAVGLMLDTAHFAIVNQNDHMVSPRANSYDTSSSWPGQFRYYRFVPVDTLCPDPILSVRGVSLSTNRTRLIWEACPFHTVFHVEYGLAGFVAGSGIQVTTSDTTLLLQDLLPDVDYEARVTAVCPYGDTAFSSLVFRTPCLLPANNRLFFANIYADSVKCCTGTYDSPSDIFSLPNMVDYSSRSFLSRHTVHSAPERCTYYGFYNNSMKCVPPTIPDGFCSSVRLGSFMSGRDVKQESVTYTLTVDTNLYDLILLHYAVEHVICRTAPDMKPRFELDITDSLGHPLEGCYRGDFIPEDIFLWSGGDFTREWTSGWHTVGVDLSPLQGQTIHVTLSHFDGYCFPGIYLHGYGYFALETAKKRIHALSCGNGVENTFQAPKGFSYNWYDADNPSVTLSTADTLRVAAPGWYCCRLATLIPGGECSFDICAYAGGRYPVSAFAMEAVNPCGSVRRFVNQSVVAEDAAHTRLTTTPCDEVFWRFDDGTTSSYVNPVHTFYEGTHTVTLYAILADGTCVDSSSQSFTVALLHDTVHGSICEGRTYHFFGRTLDEAGEYTHIADCQKTVLYLQVNPEYTTQVVDTFSAGTFYQLDGVRYRHPGVYTRLYASVHGCDSTVTLYLNSIENRDTVVCSSSLPIEWCGVPFVEAGRDTLRYAVDEWADSLVILNVGVLQQPVLDLVPEHFCVEPGGYRLSLPDSLCYLWRSVPADTSLPTGWVRGDEMALPLILSPTDTTEYYLTADYCDTLHCPLQDTLTLSSVSPVEALLDVSPPTLGEYDLDLTAEDLYPKPHERMWFINGQQYPCSDSLIMYRGYPFDTTIVRVMLVSTTPDCADTAYASVPVRVQTIWFPNVFTPGEATNNLFRGYGVNIRDYDLQVYTRWGDCIFHTKDINQGWDGTYRGVQSPMSAYAYICHYTTLEGEPRVVTGTVTLLR
ncbi:MAG: gliding motility-associated C-terminal domain-containing protein [Bacteroidales bacterium]|nr:gliding motility-associated C-terminal domain-containing protein [Bacteroidales bacterium]